METQTEQAIAAPENQQPATGNNTAVDDLTMAILSGEAPAEIQRLEVLASAATAPKPAVVEPKEEPAPEIPVEQPGTPAAEVTPAPEVEPAEPVEQPQPEEAGAVERIRLTGLGDRDKNLINAANTVARTEKIPFDEAWQRVTGKTSTPPKQEQTAPVEPLADEVSGIEAKLADVKTRLEAAVATSEGIHTNEIADLQLEHSDLRVELALAKRDKANREAFQVAREDQTFAATREASFVKTSQLFGDALKPGTPFYLECNRIATDPTHPDYDPAVNDLADAPLKIAKTAAFNLGVRPATAKVATAAAPQQAPPSVPSQPGPVAKPAPAGKATNPPPPKPSPEQIRQRSEQAAVDAIEGNAPHVGASRGYMVF